MGFCGQWGLKKGSGQDGWQWLMPRPNPTTHVLDWTYFQQTSQSHASKRTHVDLKSPTEDHVVEGK